MTHVAHCIGSARPACFRHQLIGHASRDCRGSAGRRQLSCCRRSGGLLMHLMHPAVVHRSASHNRCAGVGLLRRPGLPSWLLVVTLADDLKGQWWSWLKFSVHAVGHANSWTSRHVGRAGRWIGRRTSGLGPGRACECAMATMPRVTGPEVCITLIGSERRAG